MSSFETSRHPVALPDLFQVYLVLILMVVPKITFLTKVLATGLGRKCCCYDYVREKSPN